MIDTAQSVNNYMLANAPTLAEANPIAYALLKVLARQLIFGLKTSKEHAANALINKYARIYTQGVIGDIVRESMMDEFDDRRRASSQRKMEKTLRRPKQQPLLCV